ncbi:MAG: 5-(carboxyamino)imidazole ribonucleotide mutase [Dehalococcoidia bacterium]|nr:5-(carboxyamino)imidazole ribonucleotide mutase [Dehalococcoidia bacterium]
MMDPKSAIPQVAVVMGSKSDEPLMQPALDTLQELGIPYEVRVLSAHRTPERTREYALKAQDRGIEVIIAGAGAAAHLPGVIASWTMLPVIGVPLPTSDLKGMDSLLAMVQMPGGVPVAVVAIGSAGAKNAALLAGQMLGMKHAEIREAYATYRKKLAQG